MLKTRTLSFLLFLVLFPVLLHSAGSQQTTEHRNCQRKRPLINQVVRTSLEGFCLTHVVNFLQKTPVIQQSKGILESSPQYELIDATQLREGFRDLLSLHTLKKNSYQAPTFIIGMFLVKALFFIGDPILRKFI